MADGVPPKVAEFATREFGAVDNHTTIWDSTKTFPLIEGISFFSTRSSLNVAPGNRKTIVFMYEHAAERVVGLGVEGKDQKELINLVSRIKKPKIDSQDWLRSFCRLISASNGSCDDTVVTDFEIGKIHVEVANATDRGALARPQISDNTAKERSLVYYTMSGNSELWKWSVRFSATKGEISLAGIDRAYFGQYLPK